MFAPTMLPHARHARIDGTQMLLGPGRQCDLAELLARHKQRERRSRAIEALVDAITRKVEATHLAASPGGLDFATAMTVPLRRYLARSLRKIVVACSALREHGVVSVALEASERATCVPATIHDVDMQEISWAEALRTAAVAIGIKVASPACVIAPEPPADLAQRPARAAIEEVSARFDVVAITWTSRHRDTILPVVEWLRALGLTTLLIDCAAAAPDAVEATHGVLRYRLCHPVPRHKAAALWRQVGQQLARDAVTLPEVDMRIAMAPLLESFAEASNATCANFVYPDWEDLLDWEAWLTQVVTAARPSNVVVCNDINPFGVAATTVARRLRIRSWMLQHGFWPDFDPWPAFTSDEIVLSGPSSATVHASQRSYHPGRTHILGQPRFDRLLSLDRSAARRTTLRALGATEPLTIVVLVSNPSFGRDILRRLDQLRAETPTSDMLYLIAPHPFEDRAIYERALASNGPRVHLRPRDLPTQEALAAADVVAGFSSTALVEAILLGVPVLELTEGSACPMKLAEQGVAIPVPAALDLRSALAEFLADRAEVLSRFREHRTAFLDRHLAGCDGLAGRRIAERLAGVAVT